MRWEQVNLALEVKAAKQRLTQALTREGLDLGSLTVRIKDLRRVRGLPQGAIGLYRANSLFMSGPILWVSDSLVPLSKDCGCSPSDVQENILNILCREFGHAICDLLATKHAADYDDLVDRFGDEEVFCERFGLWLAGRDTDRDAERTAARVREILEGYS